MDALPPPHAGTARVVALGSRKNLCVNPSVLALASDARINERCGELADAARRAGKASAASTSGALKGSSGSAAAARTAGALPVSAPPLGQAAAAAGHGGREVEPR